MRRLVMVGSRINGQWTLAMPIPARPGKFIVVPAAHPKATAGALAAFEQAAAPSDAT